MAFRVLVIDDETAIREAIRMTLEYEGYRIDEARSGQDGIDKATRASAPYDAILLDIKMPVLDGIEVLENLKEQHVPSPVIMVSGHGDISTAVECTKRGAFDFLEKPLNRDKLLLSVRNAVRQQKLEEEVGELREREARDYQIVGDSQAMRELKAQIELAAPTKATVLITGESGSGKELVAREIHRRSSRAAMPFIQVNCAAIPEELIESELFGHEKGSFTGAVRKQTGKFVAADGGTIFLDEVGDMSLRTQAKVLRVLQEGEVEPVGSATVVKVDVRVIAATNKDITEEIRAGRFREDLYYRLNVIPVRTPPLRERKEDIPILVQHFAASFSEQYNRHSKKFSPAALKALQEAAWRGNVRELRNMIERIVIMVPAGTIDISDLPAEFFRAAADIISTTMRLATLQDFKDEAEKAFILAKLRENGWNVSKTADAIDTPRSNLYKKIEQYNIKREGAERWWPRTMATGREGAPIGVFDSGVGGLTVFREIARSLPHHSLIYLGDSARVPYGTKSAETVTRYALQAAAHLVDRGIGMLVVACNTATAAALPVLQETLPIPVIGVVEPGARAAVERTRGRVGVIATEGTVRSQAYTRAIKRLDERIEVIESSAPLFVSLAEEGWANTHVAREVAEIYLEPLLDANIDTLVLGCTHYPILRGTIEQVVGEGVTIVDSAETTAACVRAAIGTIAEGPARHTFLVTDAEERFRRIASDFLEREIEHLELVCL
jgi:two-component system nitrogen regulation response regulator NtrX